MTRNEILAQYDIQDGVIRTPGKFEAEPIYAPAFYDMMLEGSADESIEVGSRLYDVFKLTPSEWCDWPELDGVEYLLVWEDYNGFFGTETATTEEVDSLRAQWAQEQDDEEDA